ncbi:hypothetical protein, partial [Flavobacterium sp.]|uniref:hypothetical protein n=1 Tax=Flavobacterium sp. TaxID=239 RepID=UPI00374D9121
FSQIKNDSLINIIKSADKIMLTSHEDLRMQIYRKPKSESEKRRSELRVVNNRKGKYILAAIYSGIIKSEKPNKKIIKQKIILNSFSRNELISIISNQTNEENWGHSCFDPHQTIFILINKKWEFIDLCFGCETYEFSKGININQKTFLRSNEDWKKLESFFRSLNLTYKLPNLKD